MAKLGIAEEEESDEDATAEMGLNARRIRVFGAYGRNV